MIRVSDLCCHSHHSQAAGSLVHTARRALFARTALSYPTHSTALYYPLCTAHCAALPIHFFRTCAILPIHFSWAALYYTLYTYSQWAVEIYRSKRFLFNITKPTKAKTLNPKSFFFLSNSVILGVFFSRKENWWPRSWAWKTNQFSRGWSCVGPQAERQLKSCSCKLVKRLISLILLYVLLGFTLFTYSQWAVEIYRSKRFLFNITKPTKAKTLKTEIIFFLSNSVILGVFFSRKENWWPRSWAWETNQFSRGWSCVGPQAERQLKSCSCKLVKLLIGLILLYVLLGFKLEPVRQLFQLMSFFWQRTYK